MIYLNNRYWRDLGEQQILSLALLDYFRGIFLRRGNEGLRQESISLLRRFELEEQVPFMATWSDEARFSRMLRNLLTGSGRLGLLREFLQDPENDVKGIYPLFQRLLGVLAGLRAEDEEAFLKLADKYGINGGTYLKGPHKYNCDTAGNESAAKLVVQSLLGGDLSALKILCRELRVEI